MSSTKIRTIAFWGTTGLVALAFGLGSLPGLARTPEVAAAMTHLGYPVYFATLLAVWKLLGAAALLAPRLPRLKEWAYAGMFFNLTGAAVAHAAVGDAAGKVVAPLVLVALLLTSWALRPADRRLGGAVTEPGTRPAPALGRGTGLEATALAAG